MTMKLSEVENVIIIRQLSLGKRLNKSIYQSGSNHKQQTVKESNFLCITEKIMKYGKHYMNT